MHGRMDTEAQLEFYENATIRKSSKNHNNFENCIERERFLQGRNSLQSTDWHLHELTLLQLRSCSKVITFH